MQTKLTRIAEPMVRFCYCIEGEDTTRGVDHHNIPVSEDVKAVSAVSRKTWTDYVVEARPLKSKLLVWRVELWTDFRRGSTPVDVKSNATEERLKQLGLPVDWWEKTRL